MDTVQPWSVCSFVMRLREEEGSEPSSRDGFPVPALCPRQALQIHHHTEPFAMQIPSGLHRPSDLAREPNLMSPVPVANHTLPCGWTAFCRFIPLFPRRFLTSDQD